MKVAQAALAAALLAVCAVASAQTLPFIRRDLPPAPLAAAHFAHCRWPTGSANAPTADARRPMNEAAFQPTEYAAVLMQQLREHAPRQALDDVLDMGTGSGVVLAQMLALGARWAVGIDIEPVAVSKARRLIETLGQADRAELLQGDLWAPCAGRRFDLIATNLPQFPLEAPLADGRLPSWSAGGADGRALIDRFLQGLPAHLKPGGRAFMTHNAFIDLPLTRQRLQSLGLAARVAITVCVPLPLAKLRSLSATVRDSQLGQGLHQFGGHAFAEFHVLEITRG